MKSGQDSTRTANVKAWIEAKPHGVIPQCDPSLAAALEVPIESGWPPWIVAEVATRAGARAPA